MDFDSSLYSPKKRLRFFERQLRRKLGSRSSLNVIEIGCGTGEGLVLPLAQIFPQIHFAGVDTHRESIEHAQKKAAAVKNAEFHRADAGELPAAVRSKTWDVVITSEILEHIEDPFSVLKTASSLLTQNGLLLITVPNGYGPFEVEQFFWSAFGFEKLMGALRRLRGKTAQWNNPTTLNETNTHVCFFSWSEMKKLIAAGGFEIKERENREFFCGPFSDYLHSILKRIRLGGPLIALSQSSAKILPPQLVSDWMIAAEKVGAPAESYPVLPRGLKKFWWDVKRRLALSAPC